MNTAELSITEDWRKQASPAAPDASVQPQEDVEKAFLDQAYMHIQNKATPLMKQQYRVGFEIVHKNDENTRMVGVFVFRITDQFFYAPVFFLNGSIKGTDLLYRANVKRFVPLNNEWCEYLVNLTSMDEGHGISIRERQLTRDQLNLLDVVEPPQMFRYRRKNACWINKQDMSKDMEEASPAIEEMLTKAANIPGLPSTSILRRFITEFGGFNAIKKIANTARHDKDFAQALCRASHPDNYMPQLPAQPPHKRASVKREPMIVVHTSVLQNKNVKKASVVEMSKGYKIEDFRKEAQVNSYVYADNSQELNSVEAPGVYSILMADGTSRRMLVGFYRDMDLCSGNCPKMVAGIDPYGLGGRRQSIVLVDNEQGQSKQLTPDPNREEWAFGTYEGKVDDSDKLKEMTSAQVGESYRIYDTKDEAFSEPFYVAKKDTSPGGLEQLWISNWSVDSPEGRPILINSEYPDYDPKDNIFGKRCKLVKIKSEVKENGSMGKRVEFDSSLDVGSKAALNAFIFEQGFKRAAIKVEMVKDEPQYLVRSARSEQKWQGPFSKLSAVCNLMLSCDVAEDTAEELLKLAADAPSKSYGLLYEKKAYNVRFNDWPEFYERMNHEFQVLEQPRTNWIMESEMDRPIVMPHRVGDVWSQDSSETLDTMTPLQLYDMSKQKGIGNMFEHGVVGELTKTYDAGALVQTYVSDLELALDRLGRIIFLFYWKPEDFSASYGADDQSALENKFLSNFKAMGEMTLELLQKAKLAPEGTASLT